MPRPIYSDEVQEIMGRIPGWVVRWGLSVIFSIFIVLLGVTYFFKYPKVVTSSIVLTDESSNRSDRSFDREGGTYISRERPVCSAERINRRIVQYGRLPICPSIGKDIV